MFGILWFLLVASSITFVAVWVLDHNGNVLITWLGYQVQADILPAIIALASVFAAIFAFSYLLAKILSIKFPSFLKLFFRRNYTKSLEKMVHRHHKAFDLMVEMLLAAEISDQKTAENSHAKLVKLVKHRQLNYFLLAKLFLAKKDYSKAAEVFARFENNKAAKILTLKSKFKSSLSRNDHTSAINYAEQILDLKYDNSDVVRSIYNLYEKHGLHHEAEKLVRKYGELK